MAGVRHHIIPRFLQKGFASRTDKEEIFAWVYRKDTKPFEANTKNIFIEKHFYGKEGELSADEEITELEKCFYPLVDELRNQVGNVDPFSSQIAEFIAHLCIRTKHLRNSFRDSTDYLAEQLENYLSNVDNIKKLILNNPKLTKKLFDEALEDITFPTDMPFLQLSKEMLFPLVQSLLPTLLEEEEAAIKVAFQTLFAEIRNVIPKAIREGHIKLLTNNPVPEPRVADYKELRWFVCNSDSPVILGDIACVFETDSKRRFKPINDVDDKVINIFLPISSSKILVGTKYSIEPTIETKTLNNAIAKCSYELFISSENSNEKLTLSKLVGLWSGIVTSKELEQISNAMIKDIESMDYLSKQK